MIARLFSINNPSLWNPMGQL